ncbi:hypothetical protein DV736_g4543, partial [Chaetothyriales sp. CBS 134916]
MPPTSRRGGRSSSRRLSPQSLAKSAPQPSSPHTRRSARGDAGDLDIAQSQLPSVPESIQNFPVDPAGLAHDGVDESAPSHAPSDNFSDSQQELDALNYDLLLDSLPDLKDEAVKLVANFHRNDRDDLAAYLHTFNDPAAPSTTRCFIALKKLLATREAFGKRTWALPPVIVSKLKHGQPWPEIPDGMWRPDAILYLANLAQFVAGLALPENTDLHALLTDAFSFYPHIFSSVEPENRFTSPDYAALLRIGDALRTQFFLSEARTAVNHPGFDPDALLTRIFLDNDYVQRIAPLTALLPTYESDFETRLAQIRAAFPKNNIDPIHLESLQAAFPWDAFVLEIITWALQREQELLALIEAQDAGIEGIINAIRSGNFNIAPNPVRRPNATPSATSACNLSKTSGRARGRGGRTAQYIAAVKRDLADLAARRAAATTTTTPRSANLFENQDAADAAAALMAYNQNPRHEDSDSGGYAPVQQIDRDAVPVSAQGPQWPTQLSGSTQNAQATKLARDAIIEVEQSRQANKENATRTITKSFMDRQPNAERLTWNEDTQPMSPASGPSGTAHKHQLSIDSNISLAPDDDKDDEEESDFESDTRPTRGKRARVTAAVNKGKGGATSSSQHSHNHSYPSSNAAPFLSSSSSLAPPKSDPLPPEATYREINTKAKANVALNRERDQHIIQQRQPYSEAEVRRLIELIGLNQGPKYAKILKDDKEHPDGPLLHCRTQVQLKDKARNIKMDYLKARQPLPEGFASVSIGQRLIDVLRAMGIELVDGQPESL